jgi:hypothetical protein
VRNEFKFWVLSFGFCVFGSGPLDLSVERKTQNAKPRWRKIVTPSAAV